METIEGPDGAEGYRISGPGDAEIVFARHGGHIISWKTACGTEHLFLSQSASYGPEGAIRGGVPVIFPQFNENGPYGRHGFARKSEWSPNLEGSALILRSCEETLAIWPHEFELSVGVELAEMSLNIILEVKNTSAAPFSFQAALHTYFLVEDVAKVSVTGLAGKEFHNEVTKQMESSDLETISFGEEVDRSYRDVGAERVIVKQPGAEKSLVIESEGFPDFVVWNPGPNHGIKDLDDWQKFVCVESAQVQLGEPLFPGEKWSGRQKIRIEPLGR